MMTINNELDLNATTEAAEILTHEKREIARKYADYFRNGYAQNREDEEGDRLIRSVTDDLNAYMVLERESPHNAPELVKSRILDVYNREYPYKEPVATLSKAVDSYGLNLRILHKLSGLEVTSLLGAAAYAGRSRHTDAGIKLSKAARSALSHEMTNTWMQREDVIDVAKSDEERNLDRVLGSLHAQYVSANLGILDGLNLHDEAPVRSIDAALPAFLKQYYLTTDSNTLQDDLRRAAGIEVLDSYDDDAEPFQPISTEEVSQRLIEVAAIEDGLRAALGDDITVSYKELKPIYDETVRELRRSVELLNENDGETGNDHESGSDDFADYVFIQIEKPNGDVYVIADSPNHANACYIVRGDVMRKMGGMLGAEMTWADVLRYPKVTARQLGATRFYHTEKNNTLAKAIDHINVPLDEVMKDLSWNWCVKESRIYDAEMDPTQHNRLPRTVREQIDSDREGVRDTLVDWLNLAERPQVMQLMAQKALSKVPEKQDEQSQEELIELRAELMRRNTELAEKDAEINRLRRIIHAIADGEVHAS